MKKEIWNMKNLAAILSLLLMITFHHSFANVDVKLDSANVFYSKGEYEKAIREYENIINANMVSSEIYYNLANSYYKSNKLTKAIINYERALKLNPSDDDIKYNLELANTYITDKIEIMPTFFLTSWINSFYNLYSTDTWAIISMISFVIFLVLLAIFFLTRMLFLKKISFYFSLFIILISIISFWSSYKQKQFIVAQNTAIITNPSITAKSSPDDSGNDLFQLHEGTKTYLEEKVGNWQKFRLTDGNVGWLREKDIEII
ncbi:MAG: hypothetical protein A2W98_00535 [Bacteroidetes bacterium GWF2_33_38]|nr:MAG: hypothetical protein A2W98_00535 [Bacteroidetes bacterium GWF2_33_38]OFY71743.1 MAG: hypothetical protein A2265_02860 [Bacteroidetes bacterium RIFOXYA12_FULL_33_9]OFY90229.1 MAG: hypothetical protein A2236_02710 [Bacteroidetes bacterium RIFOXYA2_FULL_33_7]